MPDQEAVEYPESFASDEEMAAAHDPNVGDGTPWTAPEVRPKVTIVDRLRALFR
jgi:hypothetical protein